MRHPIALITAAFLFAALPLGARHENQAGPAFYKVEFTVHDGNNAAAQGDPHYTMLVDESRPGLLQAGTRVAAVTGSPQSGFLEVGANIECSVHDASGLAALQGTIGLSSITGFVSLGNLTEPTIAERKMSFKSVLTPGVATLVVDMPSNFQVHATVTRLP
jgi:hypothetical protein